MKFNINNFVKVKLTETGRKELFKQHKELRKRFHELPPYELLPKEDSEGWSSWQLWTLMLYFGHKMYNKGTVLVEIDIEIDE